VACASKLQGEASEASVRNWAEKKQKKQQRVGTGAAISRGGWNSKALRPSYVPVPSSLTQSRIYMRILSTGRLACILCWIASRSASLDLAIVVRPTDGSGCRGGRLKSSP
jgi:hypothetical protein